MARSRTQKKALAVLNYDLFKPETITPPSPATIDTKIRQHVTRIAEMTVEPQVPGADELPDISELYRMFDQYNWLYFRGKLPKVRIEYSGRMTSAGSYSATSRLIKIGRKYHQVFPDDLSDTLKHEMIHIKYPHHGAAFKKEAARVGASVQARIHPNLQRPPRYVYVCPRCRVEYPRQKRLRMASCGDCSRGGRFDPRFKLVLVWSKKRP